MSCSCKCSKEKKNKEEDRVKNKRVIKGFYKKVKLKQRCKIREGASGYQR